MSEAARRALLARLAEQFADAVADGSEIHVTEGFRVHLWHSADPFYRNVAIPVRQVADWQPAIAAMRALFEAHGRTPRLEFFAELWPGLATALEAAGFHAERRAVVMTRGPEGALAAGGPARLLAADEPRSLLAAFLARAAEAFGEPAALLAAGEVERLAAGLARGAVMAAAALEDGRPVSGASLIRAGRVAELAGVWTSAAWRRRGLARRCCARLLERFFADGGEVAWLSAGDAASAGLYRSIGFSPLGTQLNYARLPAGHAEAELRDLASGPQS
jgi:ribosomal protein S18 acetylase RimI-like enzyme